jgi:nitrite reductase/ring-hydroxylating ferredoxin subunit
MNAVNPIDNQTPAPVLIPVEAYTSQAYARAENEQLWGKAWQAACRVEELGNVGDYVTYDILDESIVVVRTANDQLRAFYNVCMHRGRRLTEGSGHTNQFFCRFHGWHWNIEGECTRVLDPEDWGGCLTAENTRLGAVRLGEWGGWVWIAMDPDCEPLESYLAPVIRLLGPYELDKMRYRWRQWLYFPCNWKTAIEAFIESYHVLGTHPELIKWGENLCWCKAEGKHAWHGFTGLRGGPKRVSTGLSGATGAADQDPRISTFEMLDYLMDTVNATTTDTILAAANRLRDELPADTPPELVNAHLMASARQDDAARGVVWPDIEPEHMMEVGIDWHVFPNTVILPGITFALCYRARPNGDDPNSCIFEVYVIERFPEGEEPETEWKFEPDPTEEKWRYILSQDFLNMPNVQQGMKSRGFPGPRPSPVQELAVIHFHKTLAEYMGTGAPQPLA